MVKEIIEEDEENFEIKEDSSNEGVDEMKSNDQEEQSTESKNSKNGKMVNGLKDNEEESK